MGRTSASGVADVCSSQPEDRVKNLLSKSASQRAISLVEVVFSMALVSILFVSLYGGIASGFGLVNLARENLRANQIIVEKMETIRLYSWDQINSNGFIPATFTETFFPTVITNVDDSNGQLRTNTTVFANGGITYFGTVTISNAPVADAYKTTMKEFIVTLNWTNSNIPRTRSLTTYVSQNGMQNYVYY
jgi:type II secretory pathway pseudopilin PulG